MSEAYFRVESGALGPQENFLSLDDILMSHEKLSVRTEIPMPRLGAFFLDRSGGAETDNAIPEVSDPGGKRSRLERLQLQVGLAGSGALRSRARCPLGFVVLQYREAEPSAESCLPRAPLPPPQRSRPLRKLNLYWVVRVPPTRISFLKLSKFSSVFSPGVC